MDAVKVNKYSLKVLRLLLEDPMLKKSVVQLDGEQASNAKVDEFGNVKIGRHKYGWVNDLFGSYIVIDFMSVVTRIADAITHGTPTDLAEMLTEIIQSYKMKVNSKEEIIDLLNLYNMLYNKNSVFKSKYIKDQDMLYLQNSKQQKPIYRGNAQKFVDLGGFVMPLQVVVESI